MIVLDEQLLGRGLEMEIAQWNPGPVRFIMDLRPNTVIKDDAVPLLLQHQDQPTFVTLNESDFWLKGGDQRRVLCCVFCLSRFTGAGDSRLLRSLFHHPQFATKSQRMGVVIRIADQGVTYYGFDARMIRSLA